MCEDRFYISLNWFKGYVIKYGGKNVIEQACTFKACAEIVRDFTEEYE